MSRQPQSNESPEPTSSNPSPVDQQANPDASASEPASSPHRLSEASASEGYPSWLPKRPPPPAPASTFHSSVGMHGSPEAGPSTSEPPYMGGRKPTPRSVRIISLQDSYAGKDKEDRREPTDQTRVNVPLHAHARAWSRATGTPMSPTIFSPDSPFPLKSRIPQPKFHSNGLHLEILRNPALISRLYFHLLPLFVFAHVPLQTFFDFNAVFILIQVSKFPNPEAPGVPGSGRNWALGAAAYIACWAVWIFVVFVVYEIVFSFVRRWRVKRPLIIPLYLSSSGFNLVSMSSYSNFCFFQHLRYTAFFGETGSIRDGLAETFWFYSQNLPTVALLLPRAGLALALLLTFSSPVPGVVALAAAGVSQRDGTFFRSADGTLTNYARGVLIANAAWTAWRALVLCFSWIGLWITSGQGCAGLCGPRYRWEEEAEKTRMSMYSDAGSETFDDIPWNWRECSKLRIQEAYEFCLTIRPPSSGWGAGGLGKKEASGSEYLGPSPPSVAPFEGMEQVMAAVGLPSVPPAARRGVLSEDLFEGPKMRSRSGTPPLSAIIPKVVKRSSKEDDFARPSASSPYPFTGRGAQVSSKDRVPFPPSPGPSDEHDSGTPEEGEEEEGEEEEEEADDEMLEGSEEPSSGRASGSMSSLGRPVTSRYPFQFRRPLRGHSNSASSNTASHMSPQSGPTLSSNSRSGNSRVSRSTQSTGNRESTDSHSPRSFGSDMPSPMSLGQGGSGIPMPPRHPQSGQGRGRARAGTVPSDVSVSSASPVMFPRGRPRAATGMSEPYGPLEPAVFESDTGGEEGVSEEEEEQMMEQPEPEGPHEAAERDDTLGLLSHSAAPSPKSSFGALRHRASNSLHRRAHGSRSGSNSRTNSNSGSASSSSRSRPASISDSVRARAQSLIQNIGAASHSSIELIRSRANSSMARLEEDSSDGRTHSRSGSGSDAIASSGENNTFGLPLRPTLHRPEDQHGGEMLTPTIMIPPGRSRARSPSHLRESHSIISVSAPSERTVSASPPHTVPEEAITERTGVPIPILLRPGGNRSASSHPDISTADPSFVTAPTIAEGTTDSSGRTLSSWGGASHMVERSGGTWGPA